MSVIISALGSFLQKAVCTIQHKVEKREEPRVDMVVKITKQCDELREEIDRWNYNRIKNLREQGYKGDSLDDAVLESNRFINLINIAVEALELGEVKKEYWILFSGDISDSPSLCLVIRKTGSRAEISRHAIRLCS